MAKNRCEINVLAALTKIERSLTHIRSKSSNLDFKRFLNLCCQERGCLNELKPEALPH